MINYKILTFNPTLGQITVFFYKEDINKGIEYTIDVPIIDNKFISGNLLDSHIRQFSPTVQLDQLYSLTDVLIPSELSNLAPCIAIPTTSNITDVVGNSEHNNSKTTFFIDSGIYVTYSNYRASEILPVELNKPLRDPFIYPRKHLFLSGKFSIRFRDTNNEYFLARGDIWPANVEAGRLFNVQAETDGVYACICPINKKADSIGKVTYIEVVPQYDIYQITKGVVFVLYLDGSHEFYEVDSTISKTYPAGTRVYNFFREVM